MTLIDKLLAAEVGSGDCCRLLLSEGLDLCVRARKLDAQDRTNTLYDFMAPTDGVKFAAMANEGDPDRPYMTRSATIPLWVEDQYQRDLADWERRSRHHLMQGCAAILQAKDTGQPGGGG